MKQIKLRIYTNGTVGAETAGIKGKRCLDYIAVLENLTGAVTADSDFTPEYRETDNLLENRLETEVGIQCRNG